MSVIKAKRTESDFKIISKALQIRKELTTYVMRDFAIDGKLDYMEEWFLNNERQAILDFLRRAYTCLELANSIYITTISEYEERRLNQNRAIGYYNMVKQELMYIIYTLPKKINTNKYVRVVQTINEEIGLIKHWRKSDKKIKEKGNF